MIAEWLIVVLDFFYFFKNMIERMKRFFGG